MIDIVIIKKQGWSE